jgi:hypothetical protein
LLDIAERSGLSFTMIQQAADALEKHDLLRARESEQPRPAKTPAMARG